MTAKFSAIECDERWSERFRKISNIKAIGIKTVVFIDTDEEITIEYMVKMAKELENMPVIDHKYLVNVRPILNS